jgi:hypothetical protein
VTPSTGHPHSELRSIELARKTAVTVMGGGPPLPAGGVVGFPNSGIAEVNHD